MSRYHWPSWCRYHRRPHIRWRQCCITNAERKEMRRILDTFDGGDLSVKVVWSRTRGPITPPAGTGD